MIVRLPLLIHKYNMFSIIDKINSLRINGIPVSILERRISSKNHIYTLTSFKEKLLLQLLAEKLNNNSVVVEVGTYLCGSASIIAHVNPSCQIYCIDTFDNLVHAPQENGLHQRLIKLSLGEGQPRTLENVKEFIKEYKNINLIKVENSNSVVTDWNIPVDVYFEDANHWEPTLSQNVNYWSAWVKVNGYMLLHDYDHAHPDVINLVEKLQQDSQWNYLGNVDSVSIFQKIY